MPRFLVIVNLSPRGHQDLKFAKKRKGNITAFRSEDAAIRFAQDYSDEYHVKTLVYRELETIHPSKRKRSSQLTEYEVLAFIKRRTRSTRRVTVSWDVLLSHFKKLYPSRFNRAVLAKHLTILVQKKKLAHRRRSGKTYYSINVT